MRNVELVFHTDRSVRPEKSLDLMISIDADDALLTDTAHDNTCCSGKAQVRSYWANVSGPFRPKPHWISHTSAMSMHAEGGSDSATVYFECLWMDVAATRSVPIRFPP